MSTYDIAADQLKCVRLLSLILPDGTLPMPSNWSIHTYPGFDPPLTPMLEGFFHDRQEPSVPVLREQIRAYADKFGLNLTERPHGNTGLVALTAIGTWQGVELQVWGPACPEEASESEPAPGDPDDGPVEPSALVTHALMPDGAEMPRCGADVNCLIATFAADVTCPECKSRLAAQLAEENGQDDPEDLTESITTEPPGDAS